MFKFLYYQRFLGLTDLHFSKSLQRFVVHATWCTIIARLLVLSVFICELFQVLIKMNVDFMGVESRTGRIFFQVVNVVAPITELMVNLWLRMTIEAQIILLNGLTDLSKRLQLDKLDLRWPQWLIRLWIGISITYLCIISHYTISTWYSYHQFQHLFSIMGYFLHIVRTNYIITCYTSLVYIVQRLLRTQADQLKRNPLKFSDKLRDYLSIHDQLLSLCQEKMVQVFGVCMAALSTSIATTSSADVGRDRIAFGCGHIEIVVSSLAIQNLGGL